MTDSTAVAAPPTAQEALESVLWLESAIRSSGHTWHLDRIRAFIESAAAEADAWVKIEAHREANRTRVCFTLGYYQHPAIQIIGRGGQVLNLSEAPTRLAALQLAAAWCEKEGA